MVSLDVVCASGSLVRALLTTIMVPGGSISVDIAIPAMASSAVRLAMDIICQRELSPRTFPIHKVPAPAGCGMFWLFSPPSGKNPLLQHRPLPVARSAFGRACRPTG